MGLQLELEAWVGFVQRRDGYSGQGNSKSKGMEAGMGRVCMEAIKKGGGGCRSLGMVGWGRVRLVFYTQR